MKPNFALNLTPEAIILLHRTARGWLAIGEAAVDSADLTEALGYLLASARGLSPQGVTTKLILPNAQILYTEVDVTGPDAAARRRQVAVALEGRTPYPVEDLVFDIWGKGPRVQVAVVARETLDEAEGFIDQHRFNPVSFVAIPPAGAFGGEPFFGQTKAATRLLAAGESVARDQDPVAIVTRDDGAPRAAKDAGRTEAAAPGAAGAQDAAGTGKAAVAAQPDAAPAAAEAATGRPPVAAVAVAENVATPPEPVKLPVEAPLHRATPEGPAVAPPPPAEAKAAAPPPLPLSPKLSVEAPPPEAAVPPVLPRAPDAAPDAPPVPATSPAGAAAVPAFASRRREGTPRDQGMADAAPLRPPVLTAATLTSAAPDLVATTGPGAKFSVAPVPSPAAGVAAAAPHPVAGPALAAPSGAAPPLSAAAPVAVAAPPLGNASWPLAAEPSVPRPAQTVPPRITTEVPAKPSAAGAASRLRSGTTKGTLPPPAKAAARPPASDGSLRPGAAAMAKGGARVRGKPRYLGLALTGALLLFLMLVAAYSSLYLSRDDPATVPETDVAGAGGSGVTSPATGDAGGTEAGQPEAPAPVIVSAGDPVAPDPELLADLAETDTAPIPETVVAAPPPATPDTVAEVAPPAAPPPAAAAGDTAVALSTASAATGQDEIFLSAVDAPPPAFDAVALPAPVAGPDAAPGTTAPPPPFGTVYQFDDQGRILAGTTGVVAPGGFWLIAARPPLTPPQRPADAVVPVVSEPVVSEPVAAVVPVPDATATAAPATAAFAPDATITPRRPPLRPAALTAPAPDGAAPLQADDDASLTRDDPRRVGLRPRPRGSEVLVRAAQAAQARQAADAAQVLASASLVTAASAEAATPVALSRPANASPLAVPLSRRPAPRPRDFSRAVAAAAAEATQPRARAEPEPAPQEQATTPEADAEPEIVATAAPRIPTRASVAKQATFANAINLSKMNLIGIYGTPSSRYAMVRTSGGRFTRVKVGDRVDGGTVAAITASEVRYKKGGRMLTLAMPRG